MKICTLATLQQNYASPVFDLISKGAFINTLVGGAGQNGGGGPKKF